MLQIAALFLSMTTLAYIPECEFKKFLYRRTILTCFHLLSRWLGVVLHFHNTEYRPKKGIAVSNHTTPFDVLLLSTDNCYSLVSHFIITILGA